MKGKGQERVGKAMQNWSELDTKKRLIRHTLKEHSQHHSHIVLSGANNPGFLTKWGRWRSFQNECTRARSKTVSSDRAKFSRQNAIHFVSVSGIGLPWNERQVDGSQPCEVLAAPLPNRCLFKSINPLASKEDLQRHFASFFWKSLLDWAQPWLSQQQAVFSS